MKLKLDKALSLVALSVIGVLQGANAAPVYEIKNLDDIYSQTDGAELIGTLQGTRSGYGMAINAQGESLGVAKGKKYLSVSEDDDGVIDIEDGIAPEERIVLSINTPIKANNFTFTAQDNDPSSKNWLPVFDSVNGTTDPGLTDPDVPETINSVDAYYYGINDSGVKVGSMTAPEQTEPYTGSTADQEFWYYRAFEERGFVKNADGTEIALVPPLTEYVKDDETPAVNVGGYSVAAKVNASGLVVGYVGTELSKNAKDRIDGCIESDTYPLDVCVQKLQFPYNQYGNSYINYQVRGYVWQLTADGTAVETQTQLPLGLTPSSSSTYTAQGLGINNEGTVVGRSHVYRRGNKDKLAYDAAYWTKNEASGEYDEDSYNWVPMIDNRYQSIAYDINDNGILVGSYKQYLQGYVRDKFFYFDTNGTEDEDIVTPYDFSSSTGISDLSSKPKDINNQGQVVGYIETTHDKEKPRPKAGFLFDINTGEFNNLNQLLTCESKGFEKVDATCDAKCKWQRKQVSVQDGTGKTLTYNEDLVVVEANSINDTIDNKPAYIVGTVSVRKPQYKFDSAGNLVIGDNGLPIFAVNGNGDPLTSYLPRMVVLQVNGEEASDDWLKANNCVDNNEEPDDYERKGAASFAWLFALPLVWFRRRYSKT
ncbi:DUF3466 family protein [Shewanella benthica]|uniref:DUF3466 family protein n=1 Tax=Shewanella benthica KT99 TaxID=314608 RepID=A9EJ78_9GAMM|nr:DUF3466 family protein [Shewanella benthica]EDP99674.1 hypothetical protein KT99_13637 [Shewanella benthica KT99]